MVMQCQTKVKAFGYCQMLWHLLSKFHLVHISMKSKVAEIQALNQPSISNDFESKLLELKLGMNSQLISVLTPFLAFFGSYINAKAHNMMVIILDLCFKT
jgi:hypothetical protein